MTDYQSLRKNNLINQLECKELRLKGFGRRASGTGFHFLILVVLLCPCAVSSLQFDVRSVATSVKEKQNELGKNPFARLVGCNSPDLSPCAVNGSPAVPAPKVGSDYIDPDYGTTIRRISPIKKTFLQNNYSPQEPWNADGTRLLLLGTDGQYSLLDGNTYALLRKLDESHLEYSGADLTPHWDPIDPDRFWYASGNKIYYYSVKKKKSKGVKVFGSSDVPAGDLVVTKDYSNISADGCVWGLSVINEKAQTVRLLVYNRCIDRVLASKSVGGIGSGSDFEFKGCPCNKVPADISVSPSGRYIIVETNADPLSNPRHFSVEIYNTALEFQRRLPADAPATHVAPQVVHSDSGFDADGDDVYVSQLDQQLTADYRAIESFRLRDGKVAKCQLPNDSYSVYPVNNWHVSMRHTVLRGGFRGWALISTFTEPANSRSGAVNIDPDVPGSKTVLNEEIFFCKLDGTNEIRRVAHDQTVRSDYFAEPHATASWDGKKVIFNSTWRTNKGSPMKPSDSTSAYVVSGW